MSCNLDKSCISSKEDDITASKECAESSETPPDVRSTTLKQKQLHVAISNESGTTVTTTVEVKNTPVLNTQDSGKGSSEEGDNIVAVDDVSVLKEKSDPEPGLVEGNDVVVQGEGEQQEMEDGFTKDEVGLGEDMVDFPENEATDILRKYSPTLVTYFSQNVFQVAVELHAKGFIEKHTRNAACELNGSDSNIKAHMILQQLEIRCSRRPAALVDCAYVLRECLPLMTDLTQDMIDEYNTAQYKNTRTELNHHENETSRSNPSDSVEKQTPVIINDREDSQPDFSATGSDVHTLQQLFSLGEDDQYMLTQRLTKVLRTVSLSQETKARDTNRKLFLTQQEVLEVQQQLRACEREKQALDDEVKQLKWLLEDTRRKNQLLNEDVVHYRMQVEKCKKACEQKAASATTEASHCGPDCEYYTKYLELDKECKTHKAEIDNLNQQVAICIRLNDSTKE